MNELSLIEWLSKAYPNKLPFKEITPFELGILIGQQQLIEQLKIKYKTEEIIDDIIK